MHSRHAITGGLLVWGPRKRCYLLVSVRWRQNGLEIPKLHVCLLAFLSFLCKPFLTTLNTRGWALGQDHIFNVLPSWMQQHQIEVSWSILVWSTGFSPKRLVSGKEYDQALQLYIPDVGGIACYSIRINLRWVAAMGRVLRLLNRLHLY